MTAEKKWTIVITVGAIVFVLVAAGITRNPALFLLAGLATASAAVIWGPKMPLE